MSNSMFKFILLFVSLHFLFAQKVDFTIKYISASHVYLQGGEKDGLAVGDVLVIKRAQQELGQVQIEYVSKYSASAKILTMNQKFKIGDVAHLIKKKQTKPAPVPAQKKKSIKTQKPKPVAKEKKSESLHSAPKTRIDGYLSFQYYYFNDGGGQKFNFSQPTTRFRLRIRNLWNRSYHLELRARSRYNMRKSRFNESLPKNEWQNRLYELTFSYDASDALLNYKIGRILSNAFSGVGYIDGLLVNFKLTRQWHVGTFAGTQPDWRTSNFQTEVQKYGSYLKYEKGDYAHHKLNVLFAGVGEYHGATVSREFVYFQTSYYYGRRWSLYQNLELDINRGWRKSRTGQNFSLTGLYVNANFHITSQIGISLSYDNRKNYYTYELRTLADSLFDHAFRHGLRANFYLNALKNYRFSLNFGLREKSTDARFSYSYGLHIARRNFFSSYNRISFRFAGFDNVFATGFNPNLTLTRYFRGGHFFNIIYGGYYYQIKNLNENRLNQWCRLLGQVELPALFYLNTTYEYAWGKDLQGHRVLLELGYRF